MTRGTSSKWRWRIEVSDPVADWGRLPVYRRLAAGEIPLNRLARSWHACVTVSLPVAAGPPQRLGRARVRGAGEDEEQIGEAVQVDGRRAGSPAAPSPPTAPRSPRAGRRRARRAAAPRSRCRPAARTTSARAAARSPRRSPPRAGRSPPARPAACRRPRRTEQTGRRRGRRARSGSARAARPVRRPAPSRSAS